MRSLPLQVREEILATADWVSLAGVLGLADINPFDATNSQVDSIVGSLRQGTGLRAGKYVEDCGFQEFDSTALDQEIAAVRALKTGQERVSVMMTILFDCE